MGRCYDEWTQAMSSARRHCSRCLEEVCGKNMLDVCCVLASYDGYIATVKIGNECQLSAYMLLLGNLATAVGTVVPAKFPCVTQRVAWCVACGMEHEADHGT